MVKVYDLGNMSKHLGEMGKGDTVLCKGPIKKLPYEANMKKKIGMIAGTILSRHAVLNNPIQPYPCWHMHGMSATCGTRIHKY